MLDPLAVCRKVVSFTGPGGGGGTGPRLPVGFPFGPLPFALALAVGPAVGVAEPDRGSPICAGLPPSSRLPALFLSWPLEPPSHFGTSTAPAPTATRTSTPSPATRDRNSHGLRAAGREAGSNSSSRSRPRGGSGGIGWRPDQRASSGTALGRCGPSGGPPDQCGCAPAGKDRVVPASLASAGTREVGTGDIGTGDTGTGDPGIGAAETGAGGIGGIDSGGPETWYGGADIG